LDVDKKEAKELLAEGIDLLSELQERLYAQDRWSVLVIFQAMDTAGKNSAIKHVMSGINPQGCEVHAFKQPSGRL
jgi:polyphosphate kinase 2 (PPK2 family)